MQNISILGIQPIGLSLALSIKISNIKTPHITAYSHNSDLINVAKSLSVFDDVSKDLDKMIINSDLIIIDAPLIEIPHLLEVISNTSNENLIVLNLNNSQTKCMAWAKDFLPESINYIGFRPIIKSEIPDIDGVSHLLLDDINVCIMPSPAADEQSVKNITRLVEKIGSTPYFIDTHEHDSYFTAMDKISDVISAAYINATTSKPSWVEMYKSAGIQFDNQSKNASTKDPVINEAECLTLSEPLIYWIDEIIGSLMKFKKTLQSENDDLLNYLITSWEQKAKWETGSMTPESNSPHLPSAAEAMGNTILGNKLSKRLTGNHESSNQRNWKYPK